MAVVERITPAAAPPPAAADGIPVSARRRTSSPRQVFAATLVGSALLALLAASDLPAWAERLPDRAPISLLRDLAIGWNRDMARLGLTAPHEALRHGMQWLLDRQWR